MTIRLSIFGGKSLFETPLHVGAPNIGSHKNLIKRIEMILQTKRLTNAGPMVQELESEISKRLDVKHVIAMCNGTVALEIAIRALDLNGEVIVPAMTFIATAHALRWQRINPVFADIDPDNHLLDPNRIQQLITPSTTAILGVHLWGRPCNVEALQDIANKNKLRLIFDAAHAFGSSHNGKNIGNFGDAEVFSFHATKVFNTFEGGAVTTNNDSLAEKIRLMQNFGFYGWDNVINIGTNGKMNEVSAAMGLTSLENVNSFIEINYKNFQTYRKQLNGVPGLKLIDFEHSDSNNFQYVVTTLEANIFGLERDEVIEILHAENIIARRYFYPGCHKMEPYISDSLYSNVKLPQTDILASKLLILPTGSQLSTNDIVSICRLLLYLHDNAKFISKKMQRLRMMRQ